MNRRTALRKFIADFRAGKSCAICGKISDELQFHHRDPSEKLGDINALIRQRCTFTKLQAEIAKCDLLCNDCHVAWHKARDKLCEQYNLCVICLAKNQFPRCSHHKRYK